MDPEEYFNRLRPLSDEELVKQGVYCSNWPIVTSATYPDLVELVSSWKNWTLKMYSSTAYANHQRLPVLFMIGNYNALNSAQYKDVKQAVDPQLRDVLKTSMIFHHQEGIESEISQVKSLAIVAEEIHKALDSAKISYCLLESVVYGRDYSKMVSRLVKK